MDFGDVGVTVSVRVESLLSLGVVVDVTDRHGVPTEQIPQKAAAVEEILGDGRISSTGAMATRLLVLVEFRDGGITVVVDVHCLGVLRVIVDVIDRRRVATKQPTAIQGI